MSRNQKTNNNDNTDSDIITIIQKQHDELQRQYDELQRQYDELQRQYDELQRQHEKDLETITSLQETIANLQLTINNLHARLNTNSGNSSLPPSHDVVPHSSKNRSLRTKSGKKVGGQPNHKGVTRELVDEPDTLQTLKVDCCSCGCSLKNVPVDHIVRRQEIELPAIKYTITEFQGEVKKCPRCGKMISAKFPKEVPHTISFGPNLKADIAYNRIYQSLPINKIIEYFFNRYLLKLSQGTIEAKIHEMAQLVYQFIQSVKEKLLRCKYIHCDETGVNINGKRQWIHTIGTPHLTLYHVHEKRGAEAMIENGVLPKYGGTIMSDYWLGYNKFPANHTYCKAHIIRELRWVSENFKEQIWAGKLEQLLGEMYAYTQIHNGNDSSRIKEFEDKYDEYIDKGLAMNPNGNQKSKNGRLKKTKIRNLLERLKKTKTEVLLFLHDSQAPYTNNLAERDLRPTKVQQKISGCYRTKKGAEDYCAIKGYLSTVAKNGKNIFEACNKLARGEVFSLDEILTP